MGALIRYAQSKLRLCSNKTCDTTGASAERPVLHWLTQAEALANHVVGQDQQDGRRAMLRNRAVEFASSGAPESGENRRSALADQSGRSAASG
jgi:hypothetical protein